MLNNGFKYKIAGVVILYNPYHNLFENIKTYIDQIDFLFVIDNSEKKNKLIIDYCISNKKIDYTFNGENIGVAAALNLGARKAIDKGYLYLLMMDQDSKASNNLVVTLAEIMAKSDSYGIVSSDQNFPHKKNKPKEIFIKEMLYTITSGSLLNLKAFSLAGDFDENLFIDHVDHEYCLRLLANGYKVIQTNITSIDHSIGKPQIKKIFHLQFGPTNHSPLRLYYRTRNRLYVNKLYKKTFPQYVKEDIKHMIRELFEIILFERNVFQKINMMMIGFKDFKKNKLGKYHFEK